MRGEGIFAEQISQMFHVACRKAKIEGKEPELSTGSFRRMDKDQGLLFEQRKPSSKHKISLGI
jgi:hypothetical protein